MPKLVKVLFEIDETRLPKEVLTKNHGSIQASFHEILTEALYEIGEGSNAFNCADFFEVLEVTDAVTGELDKS